MASATPTAAHRLATGTPESPGLPGYFWARAEQARCNCAGRSTPCKPDPARSQAGSRT
jgi:hypothetical protein